MKGLGRKQRDLRWAGRDSWHSDCSPLPSRNITFLFHRFDNSSCAALWCCLYWCCGQSFLPYGGNTFHVLSPLPNETVSTQGLEPSLWNPSLMLPLWGPELEVPGLLGNIGGRLLALGHWYDKYHFASVLKFPFIWRRLASAFTVLLIHCAASLWTWANRFSCRGFSFRICEWWIGVPEI